MNTPKVLIIGQCGSGKSSLAFLIANALKEHNISSVIHCEDEPDYAEVARSYKTRIKRLEGKEVNISIMQSVRPLK